LTGEFCYKGVKALKVGWTFQTVPFNYVLKIAKLGSVYLAQLGTAVNGAALLRRPTKACAQEWALRTCSTLRFNLCNSHSGHEGFTY